LYRGMIIMTENWEIWNFLRFGFWSIE
jgi:hypothetical protein